MPELPEVQTVVDTLEILIQNKRIVDIDVKYPPIIDDDVNFESNVTNQQFKSFDRKGKFLILGLNDGYLVIHLRMEGKFYVVNQEHTLDKHSHLVFHLDDGQRLIYHDVRKFGRIHYVKQLDKHKGLNRLGLEIWDDKCNVEYLSSSTKRRTIAIKTLLLDQSVISGIGNIYANEILFDSKIDPKLKSNQLTDLELERILISTKEILDLAIEQGGTSIRSYTSQFGVTGRFQQYLKVHGRDGQPCLICNEPIVKEQVNGRGTYFCPKCQKSSK